MTRLEEIEARMAAITEECEQENADIDALTEDCLLYTSRCV